MENDSAWSKRSCKRKVTDYYLLLIMNSINDIILNKLEKRELKKTI